MWRCQRRWAADAWHGGGAIVALHESLGAGQQPIAAELEMTGAFAGGEVCGGRQEGPVESCSAHNLARNRTSADARHVTMDEMRNSLCQTGLSSALKTIMLVTHL